MKQVNDLIKTIPKDSTSKQQTPTSRWSLNTQKAVLGLFARFSDLYGELAKAKGLEIYRGESSELTREFQLWCLKLNDVDMEGIARGVANLEKQIEENSKNGVKSYPPSYAEFRGLCHRTEKKAMHRSWAGLPKPKMTDEQRKEKMKALRKEQGV